MQVIGTDGVGGTGANHTGNAGKTIGSSDGLIRRGDRGGGVSAMQTALNQAGYDVGGVDGIYGNGTYNALVRFQRDHGLTADGVYGPSTKNALAAAIRGGGGSSSSSGSSSSGRSSGGSSRSSGGGSRSSGGGSSSGSGSSGASTYVAPSIDWDSWYNTRKSGLDSALNSQRSAYNDINGYIDQLYGVGEGTYNTNTGNLNSWKDAAQKLYEQNLSNIAGLESQGKNVQQQNQANLDQWMRANGDIYNANMRDINGLGSRGESLHGQNVSAINNWRDVGTRNYNENVSDINGLEREGRGNYDNAFQKVEDYLSQGRRAAEENKSNVTSTYGTQADLLQQMYQESIANLQRLLNEDITKTQQESEDAQRATYINNRLQDRALGQQLSASGLTGGMSETARARLANTYNTQLGNLRDTTAQNVANLRSNYLTNLSNAEIERLNRMMQQDQARVTLLNNINDRLTDVTGNYTSMYNGVNSDLNTFLQNMTGLRTNARNNYTDLLGQYASALSGENNNYGDFLTNLTGLRNNARDNYGTVYGNYTNATNQVNDNLANFLLQTTGLRNTANDNWNSTLGNYTSQINSVNNDWRDFNSNITSSRSTNRNNLSNAESSYYNALSELQAQMYQNEGYYPSSSGISGVSVPNSYNAAQNQSWYNPQYFTYNPVSTAGTALPATVANPTQGYQMVSTDGYGYNYSPTQFSYNPVDLSGVDTSYNFSINPTAQQAMTNMGNYGDIHTLDAQFTPEYQQALLAALQAGQYQKQSIQQAQATNTAQAYQRYLAQAQIMSNQGANAQQIANTLVQAGVRDASTLEQILRQIA